MKIIVAALTGAVFLASAANAAVDIYVSQSGTSVIAQTIGSFDFTDLAYERQVSNTAQVRGYYGYIATGAYGVTVNRYDGLLGSDSFTVASSPTAFYTAVGSGDAFGVNLGNMSVFAYDGYVNGTAINSTATWASSTIASLELKNGTYVLTAPHDTITVHIGEAAPAAVPEPASWAMFIGGFGMIGGALRRRQRTTVHFA